MPQEDWWQRQLGNTERCSFGPATVKGWIMPSNEEPFSPGIVQAVLGRLALKKWSAIYHARILCSPQSCM